MNVLSFIENKPWTDRENIMSDQDIVLTNLKKEYQAFKDGEFEEGDNGTEWKIKQQRKEIVRLVGLIDALSNGDDV